MRRFVEPYLKGTKQPTQFTKDFCLLFHGGLFCYEILELIAFHLWIGCREEYFQMYVPGSAGEYLVNRKLFQQLIRKELKQKCTWKIKLRGTPKLTATYMIPMEGALAFYGRSVLNRNEYGTYYCELNCVCPNRSFQFMYRQFATYGLFKEYLIPFYREKTLLHQATEE